MKHMHIQDQVFFTWKWKVNLDCFKKMQKLTNIFSINNLHLKVLIGAESSLQ